MPTGNKIMTGPDLSAILEGLINAEVNFILVGGLAAVVQGAPVTTMDVDIVHSRSSKNIIKLLAFLKSIGAFHRRLDEKIIIPSERDISGKGHALFSTQLGPLDVLAVIEQGKTYEDLLEHTVDVKFRGHTIKVLDLKMMIELKRASRDLKDKQRLPILEETLRQLKKNNGSGSTVGKVADKDTDEY